MGTDVYEKGRHRLMTSALAPHISLESCFLLAEHDCHPDHRNRHADHITAWIDHPVNWKFVAQK